MCECVCVWGEWLSDRFSIFGGGSRLKGLRSIFQSEADTLEDTSCEVVYFKKHLTSMSSLGKKVFTTIKCSVLPQDNRTGSRRNGESTPNLIK